MFPDVVGDQVNDIHRHGNAHQTEAAEELRRRRKIGQQIHDAVEHEQDAVFLLPESTVFGVAVVLVEGEIDQRVFALKIADAGEEHQDGNDDGEQVVPGELQCHGGYLPFFHNYNIGG